MFKKLFPFFRFYLAEGEGDPGSGGNPPAITAEAVGALQGDAFRAVLPKDFAAKPYMKDVNTFGDFVKKFDGAQTLLGQRVTPDENSTPEQWKEFHSKLAPKTADGYKLPETIEGLSADLTKKALDAKWIKPLFHSAQLTPYQVSVLYPAFMKMIVAAETADKKVADEKFAKMSGDLFKDQKEAIITNAKKFMSTHIPAEMQPMLNDLDEKSLTMLIALTDGMAKKFTGEDPFRGGSGGTGPGGGETEEQLIGQMQAIMRDPCYSDPFKDKPKHAELNQRMEVIRGKLKKLRSGT